MTTQSQTPFTVAVFTDQSAALLAGIDYYGVKHISVTPSTLTDRQRATLAALNFSIQSGDIGAPIAGNEPIESLLDKKLSCKTISAKIKDFV